MKKNALFYMIIGKLIGLVLGLLVMAIVLQVACNDKQRISSKSDATNKFI